MPEGNLMKCFRKVASLKKILAALESALSTLFPSRFSNLKKKGLGFFRYLSMDSDLEVSGKGAVSRDAAV
jgi:hypothetical protein